MKSFLKVVVYAAISLAIIVFAVYLWGAHMPEAHIASRVVNIDAPPQKVWDIINDYQSLPTWVTGVKSVEPLPSENGQTCYVEVRTQFRAPMCVTFSDPPRKLVHTITSAESPFQGTWTYELRPISGQRTQLTITEEGRIANPIYRYISYQMGTDTHIKSFDEDLVKRAAK